MDNDPGGATFRVRAAPPDPDSAGRLMRGLPEWFGIEESIDDYVAAARRMTTFVAVPVGRGQEAPADPHQPEPIGLLLLDRHFPECAEIHLMAVDRNWHRRGVGRALVEHAEHSALSTGAKLLEVKTLGPSRPDAGYADTREFYLALGFIPVEEMLDLWPGNPCLVMVKPLR